MLVVLGSARAGAIHSFLHSHIYWLWLALLIGAKATPAVNKTKIPALVELYSSGGRQIINETNRKNLYYVRW